MFSPVKAITAGAVVFALGGLFLVAQPFGQQRSVPGAEGAEPLAPVYVTGETVDRACEGAPDPVVEGPVQRGYGGTCASLKEWSDPLLEGTDVRADNSTDYDLGTATHLASTTRSTTS